MAGGRGGKRTPRDPAPVSGPGALSQRTDGGPGQAPVYVSGLPYGDGQELYDLQTQAPLSAVGPVPTSSAQGPSARAVPSPAAAPVPFDAPSEYPDEPLTAGADAGPGPDSSSLSVNQVKSPNNQQLMRILPALLKLADDPNTSPETRDFVRYLRGTL